MPLTLTLMLKRLINYLRKPLTATVVRRYRITSGSVGELYIANALVCDTLDTFSEYELGANTTCNYGDFVALRQDNLLFVNDKALDARRIYVSIRNNWVDSF